MLLPVSFDLAGREVLLIGGGRAALEKLAQLKRTACRLKIVATRISPEIRAALDHDCNAVVEMHEREFRTDDLAGIFMVFSAIDDQDTAQRIFALCREQKILINSADDKARCDFFTNAVIERGPVQVSVSTGGGFAGLSAIVRRHLERLFPAELDGDWQKVFALRERAVALQSVSEKKSVITNMVRDIEQKYFTPPGKAPAEEKRS